MYFFDSGVISRGAKGAWPPLEFRNICTRLQFAQKMLKNIDFPHEVEGWIRFCTPYELTEFLRKIQNVVKIVTYLLRTVNHGYSRNAREIHYHRFILLEL